MISSPPGRTSRIASSLQEFRFASPEGSGPLKWLGGLYLYKKRQDHTLDLNYGQGAAEHGHGSHGDDQRGGFSDIKTHGYAVFGQATYTLFDKLDSDRRGSATSMRRTSWTTPRTISRAGWSSPAWPRTSEGRKHDDVSLPEGAHRRSLDAAFYDL